MDAADRLEGGLNGRAKMPRKDTLATDAVSDAPDRQPALAPKPAAAADLPVMPQHVGFILDGNRRWAQEQGLNTLKGHRRGADVLRDTAIEAINIGVKYVSAFVFSTENWARSRQEVSYLMRLIIHFAEKNLQQLIDEDIRLIHVGAREGLPPAVLRAIDTAVEKSAKGTKGVLALCINYGGHQEIVDATRRLLRERIDPVKLTVKQFAKALYAPELPDLDLIVRTSGEYRISNFMLWRAAYAELMFVDKYWPDFTKADLKVVLGQYALRERRIGK